jgi:putative transposase
MGASPGKFAPHRGDRAQSATHANAVMERFFWSLKHEWTNHESFANLEEARLSVFRYIETFYNSQRIHETLDYLSPNDYEAENAPAVAA